MYIPSSCWFPLSHVCSYVICYNCLILCCQSVVVTLNQTTCTWAIWSTFTHALIFNELLLHQRVTVVCLAVISAHHLHSFTDLLWRTVPDVSSSLFATCWIQLKLFVLCQCSEVEFQVDDNRSWNPCVHKFLNRYTFNLQNGSWDRTRCRSFTCRNIRGSRELPM